MEKIKMVRIRFLIMVIASVTGGIMIYLVDSSKGWDDTGVTAGMLFLFSAFCGSLHPKRFWIWALLAGVWIPLDGIVKNNDFMFLLILLIPLAGSLAGAVAGKTLKYRNDKK